jgi:NAD(P)-dependent dehydrogenase (short-subunit alcohol dehydrogenase family)
MSFEKSNKFADQTALVTGANSGVGFEAAAQLAEAGYGRVILACRSLAKAEAAKQELAARLGMDPFETLVVDVSSIESANRASDELVKRGVSIDSLLLNAGMVSGSELNKSRDGFEIAFASSIIGHHVMTLRLLEAGLLPEGSRVVISGSEAARGDLPAMMDMKLYDFAAQDPHEFGDDLHTAMINFIRAEDPSKFSEFRYYAITKLFTSWWTAAMARRFGDRISIFAVSPGSSLTTNAGRHTKGFKRFMFRTLMPAIGPLMGMHQSVSVAAKRYVDVLHGARGEFTSGRTYTSKPKKLVGPLAEQTYPHMLDEPRQEVAFRVLEELTGSTAEQQHRSVA